MEIARCRFTPYLLINHMVSLLPKSHCIYGHQKVTDRLTDRQTDRTMLCVSAVFAVGQCLSVRPSVTFVYCIQTAEDVVKLLSQPGSPIILAF